MIVVTCAMNELIERIQSFTTYEDYSISQLAADQAIDTVKKLYEFGFDAFKITALPYPDGDCVYVTAKTETRDVTFCFDNNNKKENFVALYYFKIKLWVEYDFVISIDKLDNKDYKYFRNWLENKIEI